MGLARTLQLRPEPLPSQGDLTSTPFAVLLGWARALGATGVLSLGGEKFVFFLRGTPVHVDSLLAEETSEVYLRTRIPAGEDAAKMDAARATARGTGRGVGEALLGLGWLDPSELFEHKKAHTREKLLSCFNAHAGSIRFEPRENFGSEFLPIPMEVADVLREGISRYYDRRRLDQELPIDDLCRVAVSAQAQQAVLATEEARIIQLAAGRPTLRSLATEAAIRPDELRRRLYALYCLGLVAFEVGAPIAEESPAEKGMAHPLPVPKPGAPPTSWAGRPPSSPGEAGSKPPAPAAKAPTPAPAPSPAPAARPATGVPPVRAAQTPARAAPTPPPPKAATPSPPVAAARAPAPTARPAVPRSSSIPPPPATPRPGVPPSPPPGKSPTQRPAVPPSRSAMPRPPLPPTTTTPRPPVPPSRPAMPRPPIPGTPPVGTPRPPPASPPPRRDPTGTFTTRREDTGKQAARPRGEAADKAIQDAIDSAEIARANDDHADAIDILRSADKEFPAEPRILAQLALTLVEFDPRQYAREGNQLAKEARAADPSLALPYVVAGILLEQMGQKEQAAQMYRHALARDGSCVPASRRMQALDGYKPTK